MTLSSTALPLQTSGYVPATCLEAAVEGLLSQKQGTWKQFRDINVEGTQRTLDAARMAGVKRYIG